MLNLTFPLRTLSFLLINSGRLVESSAYFSSFDEDISNITVTDSEIGTEPDDPDNIGDTQPKESHNIQMNSSDFLTSEGNNNQQQQQTLSNTLTNDTMVASPSEEWSIQTIYGSQLETASEPSQPPIDQKPQMKIEDQDGKSNTLTNNTIIYGGQPEITSEPSQPPIDQDSKIEDQETETDRFDFDYTNFHTEAKPSNTENQSSNMKPILFIMLGSLIVSIALGLALLFCAHMRKASQDMICYEDDSSICTDDFSTDENKVDAKSSYQIGQLRNHSLSAYRSQHSRHSSVSHERNPQDIDSHSIGSKLSNQSSRSITTCRSLNSERSNHSKRSRPTSNKRVQIHGSKSNTNNASNTSRNYHVRHDEDIPFNSEAYEDTCVEECAHDNDSYYDGGVPYEMETSYSYNHGSYTAHDISAGTATSGAASLFDDRSAFLQPDAKSASERFEEEVDDEGVYT